MYAMASVGVCGLTFNKRLINFAWNTSIESVFRPRNTKAQARDDKTIVETQATPVSIEAKLYTPHITDMLIPISEEMPTGTELQQLYCLLADTREEVEKQKTENRKLKTEAESLMSELEKSEEVCRLKKIKHNNKKSEKGNPLSDKEN